MRYKIQLIKEEVPVATKKKSEVLLRDLLEVVPKLRKHKLEGEIITKVRKLRDGRRQKAYTLELSRQFPTYDVEKGKIIKELKVSAPIPKSAEKKGERLAILKDLKGQIVSQIQALRKSQLPPIETYSFREGVRVKKLAEVYLEVGTFIKLSEKKVRLNMNKAKSPKDSDRYVGLEIELMCKQDREVLCDKLFEAGIGKYVHVKGDGSIRVTDKFPHGHEITVLVRETEYVSVVSKLCEVLNTQVEVNVDKSCGLHVHLDMRNRNVEKSFVNLVAMQHFLYAMVPANRSTGTYSIPVKNKKWHLTEGHYHGVNSDAYRKYKTIELRMHCGTAQANKINNFVAFLIAIADAAPINTAYKSVKEAQAFIGISDELVKYVDSRIAKFEKQHAKVAKGVGLDPVEPVAAFPDAESREEQSEVA